MTGGSLGYIMGLWQINSCQICIHIHKYVPLTQNCKTTLWMVRSVFSSEYFQNHFFHLMFSGFYWCPLPKLPSNYHQTLHTHAQTSLPRKKKRPSDFQVDRSPEWSFGGPTKMAGNLRGHCINNPNKQCTTVDGRNPKQPPGMVLKPVVNKGDKLPTSTG